MKKTNNKKAYTLMELIAIIAIISILATIWVNIYSEQLKKSRDSTRTSDILEIQFAIEEIYSTDKEYPKTTSLNLEDRMLKYLDEIPRDPINKNDFTQIAEDKGYTIYEYLYNRFHNLPLKYEISTTFESKANMKNKAEKDNNKNIGNRWSPNCWHPSNWPDGTPDIDCIDDYRYEIWNGTDALRTSVDTSRDPSHNVETTNPLTSFGCITLTWKPDYCEDFEFYYKVIKP